MLPSSLDTLRASQAEPSQSAQKMSLSAHSDRDYQAQPAEAQASWLLGVVLKSSPGYARSGSSCPGEDLHGTLADLTFAKLA